MTHLQAACAALLAFSTLCESAQSQDQPPATIPPQVVLGRRVETLRLNLKVSPTVVIAANTAEYTRAIARWTLLDRFPVLIDDGSPRAREDIARFVRAFEPKSVLRWATPAEPLPKAPAEFRAAVQSAAWSAWGAHSAEQLDQIWKETQFTPFGVVVCSASDPAWTAGLALAAGRGQPIVWVDSAAGSVSQFVPEDAARTLDHAIATGLDNLARPWRTLGDEIDSITICLNHGANVNTPAGRVALTDLLARNDTGDRAAWTGIVHGDEPAAAYRAMSALFLQPRSAWLFDGYSDTFAPPYAVAPAAAPLQEAGLDVATNTPPGGGLSHWRRRTQFGVHQEFIHVNSSGNADFFDLSPGRAFAGDVPLLHKPAMVHFIHSFSAQAAADPHTIAGRWLENGAYCYAGSMDEPFLGAFISSVMATRRLLAGAPFAAAVRQDVPRVWKINVFGDPLATLGKTAPRHEAPLSLEGASDLKEEARAALKAKDLVVGATLLVLLGRDEDAMRLAQASLADPEQPGMPDLAEPTIRAAYRVKKKDVFYALYGKLLMKGTVSPVIRDALWQAARDDLDSTTNADLIGWLRLAIRDECPADDAEALAPAMNRVFGIDAARSMYASLIENAKSENAKDRLRKDAVGY